MSRPDSLNPLRGRPRARTAALTEIAWNEIAALQFAIAFAQMPKEDALDASDQVREFVGSTKVDAKTLREIQNEVRRIVFDYWRDRFAGYEYTLSEIISDWPTRERSSRKGLRTMANREAMPIRDRFVDRFVRLFKQFGDRLRDCPALQAGGADRCGRLFLMVTRKEFCSEQCRARTYMRQARQRDREEKERRAYGQAKRTRRR